MVGVVHGAAAAEDDTPELNQLIMPPLHKRIELGPELLFVVMCRTQLKSCIWVCVRKTTGIKNAEKC